MPYLRNPNFTGRDALLDELHAKLTDGRIAFTAVRGMGGVGKTQLALEYAYRHAGDFDLVWWLRAEEPATLLEDYAALAEPLGVGKAGEGELAALADAVRQALTRRDRWLLVFDNATGPDDVTGLLPKAGVGRVLITSRNPSWPLAVPLDVPVLSRDAAIGFLLEQTEQDDRNAADAVASELGDLPLALAQAAAYMTETGVGLAGYLDLFRTRRHELWAEERPPADYPATVGTTMATDRLRAREPLAVDLLSLCAFLAPEAIPRRLLAEHHAALPEELGAAVAEPLRLNRLVAALRRYSLVEVTGEALSFHRLVQAAARDALEPEERRRWVEAAVALMRAGFPYDRDDPATWAPSGALLAHALAAAGHAEETARTSKTRGGCSTRLPDISKPAPSSSGPGPATRGHSHLPRRLSARMTRKSRRTSTTWAGCCRPWAIWRAPGRPSSGRSRSTRRASAPTTPTSPSTSTTWAGCCRTWAIWRAPGRPIERALAIDEKSFGPDHPNVAIRVNNLGAVLQDLGDLAGAKAAFERALAIDEKSFGPDHPRSPRRQQPGRGAAGPGRSGGRQGGLRAGARDRREELRPRPPQGRHPRQQPGLWCCKTWAIWRAPGRPSSGRSRSTRRASAPTTPTSPRRQQPGHGAKGPGRSGGRQGGLRAGAQDLPEFPSGRSPEHRYGTREPAKCRGKVA